MCKKIYSEKNAIRDNLLQLIYLRDKATHLLVEEIRFSISQLFQSSIINYIEEYKNNFGQIPLADDMTGMLCLIIPGNDKISEIKNIYGEKTEYEIKKFLEELTKLSNDYNSDNFMTKINYNAYIEKKVNQADIIITQGKEGKEAVVLERIIDPKDKYSYGYKQIIEEIRKTYPKFNQHIMQLFMKKHNIYNNEKYHYEFRNSHSYSQSFINFIKSEISNDSNFFENIRIKN